MKTFVFTFVIFGLGWLSSSIHDYLYKKHKEKEKNNGHL